MDNDSERLEVTLNEIWRSCRKIQSTIFRYGFDICSEFCRHDPKGTGLISQSLFTSILAKYKNVSGISEFEIRELTDYFRLRDGRVAYGQFCKVVANEPQLRSQARKGITSGLEWNDPMHMNVIPHPEDRRRLCLTLMKIAQYAPLPLKPYFQDYEMVSHHAGNVTISHFSRILHFMKIPLSDDDFDLLLKRYMKDSYLVNYVAFLKHIENILEYVKVRNLTDVGMDIVKDFPGRIVDLELPELPPVDGVGFKKLVFPDACDHTKPKETDCDLIMCIQSYVYKRRVRIREFLEGFDHLRTGSITRNQFERGLDIMGVAQSMTRRDIQNLCDRYKDPIDTNRVLWRNFEDEIDKVFTIKHLDKMPEVQVKSPPKYIKKMLRPGELEWSDVPNKTRNLCEDALARIQIRIKNRRLHLHPFFRILDKLNSGHVRCKQAYQVLLTNGILLSNDELVALKARFGNELGFNYMKFLEVADPAEYAIPKFKEPAELEAQCPAFIENKADGRKDEISDPIEAYGEEFIIKILSDAKREVIVKSIPLMNFLQDYDRHREGEILEADFKRAFASANVKIPPDHLDVICKIFRSPKRACCVLYRDFCNALDEIFIKLESSTGDNEITCVPLIHLANLDCVECALNFDERTVCSQALMKLARRPDEISNLSSVFQDFDKENCGTISQNQFLRALTVRDMHYIVSRREIDTVCKCFGVQRGLQLEFNYREFLNVLNVLFRTGQMKRFY